MNNRMKEREQEKVCVWGRGGGGGGGGGRTMIDHPENQITVVPKGFVSQVHFHGNT